MVRRRGRLPVHKAMEPFEIEEEGKRNNPNTALLLFFISLSPTLVFPHSRKAVTQASKPRLREAWVESRTEEVDGPQSLRQGPRGSTLKILR